MQIKEGMKILLKTKNQFPQNFDRQGNLMFSENFYITIEMFEFLGKKVTVSKNVNIKNGNLLVFKINEDSEKWWWCEDCIDIDYMKKQQLKKFLKNN